MRINTYAIKLNEDRVGTLVKEAGINYGASTVVDRPERAVEIMNHVFDAKNLPEERFWLICLNGARKVSGLFEVSRGTLTNSLAHPREVFQRAILAGAASVIIVHNHPSGELGISEQDREVTKRIRQAGELLGIQLDDHIIIAEDSHISVA